ncbi:MAG: hypothetical protein ACTSUK_00955 [Promethearchaeota archaeon]
MHYNTIHEPLTFEKKESFGNLDQFDQFDRIILPPLTTEMESILNPLVPPTSGLRMEIYDLKDEKTLFMPISKQFLFLRAFRAISEVAKEEIQKERPGVLLVSDDRPSSSYLLEYFAKILAYNNYQIYFQKPTYQNELERIKDDPFYSRMSTPYASASVKLFDEVDLVIVLTASHNGIVWNGIKFYIKRPMPIAGRVMKAVSEKSISYSEILLKNDFQVGYLDANAKNNEYILDVVQNMMDISILKGKKVLLWPYLGTAPELQDLFNRVGMEVVLVNEEMEPPNPTVNIQEAKLKEIMLKNNTKAGILLDADRDRIVFAVLDNSTHEIEILQPNSLYTAMHNILTSKFKLPLINVRTIPSDPRADSKSLMTFTTGVGYKHLGIVLYAALNESIDPTVFQTAILYRKTDEGYKKINKVEEIQQILATSLKDNISRLIFVLWEESGGHTFNIIEFYHSENKTTLNAKYPPIGDKYPAEALLILIALIEKGYFLKNYLDLSIGGTRSMIKADDKLKLQIVEHFSSKDGAIYNVNGQSFEIGNFSEVNGRIAIIYLRNNTTEIYFRPSGTGPGVRIYIFGPQESIEKLLQQTIKKINKELN